MCSEMHSRWSCARRESSGGHAYLFICRFYTHNTFSRMCEFDEAFLEHSNMILPQYTYINIYLYDGLHFRPRNPIDSLLFLKCVYSSFMRALKISRSFWNYELILDLVVLFRCLHLNLFGSHVCQQRDQRQTAYRSSIVHVTIIICRTDIVHRAKLPSCQTIIITIHISRFTKEGQCGNQLYNIQQCKFWWYISPSTLYVHCTYS